MPIKTIHASVSLSAQCQVASGFTNYQVFTYVFTQVASRIAINYIPQQKVCALSDLNPNSTSAIVSQLTNCNCCREETRASFEGRAR